MKRLECQEWQSPHFEKVTGRLISGDYYKDGAEQVLL
jgi:hypothetical protein